MSRIVTALALVVFLAGCGLPNPFRPYRMEIQQGNFVSQEMMVQLKPGLTREQVRFILGTPLVADIFHADRWDYFFMRQLTKSSPVEERRISVFFKDDKLVRIEGDVIPAASAAAEQK